MLFYENEKCPVCDKEFVDGDDIVTCPECGTPHHRNCYEELKHCANANKHGENFEYKKTATNKEKDDKQTENKSPKFDTPKFGFNPSQVKDEKAKCDQCGAEIEKGVPFCNVCGAKQPISAFKNANQNFQQFQLPVNEYKDSNEKIDGESLEDISTVIGKNSHKFIEFFKKGKNSSWNWGAFIFGAYYFFYRKVYNVGAIMLAINYAVLGLCVSLMRDSYQMMISVYNSIYTNGGITSDITDSQLIETSKFCYIVLAAILLVRIVFAIYANRLYKNKVFSVIKKTKEKVENGEDINVNIMFANSVENANVGKHYVYNLYLANKGGTSILIPLIVYCLVDLIMNVI